jgi:hypothetical protein
MSGLSKTRQGIRVDDDAHLLRYFAHSVMKRTIEVDSQLAIDFEAIKAATNR